MSNQTLIECWRGRTRTFDLTMFQSDCTTPYDFITGQVVRLKIGRGDRPLMLDLSSIEPSPGGSSLVPAIGSNVVVFTIGQDDTFGWVPGAYDYEFALVDGTQTTEPIITGWTGVFFLHPTAGGEIAEGQSSSSQSELSGSSAS